MLARGNLCQEQNDEQLLHRSTKLDPIQTADININENLSEAQKDQLLNLINKYRPCFAKSIEEIGCDKFSKMSIKLTADKTIFYRPYRMPHSERELVKDIVAKLKECDIVRDSNSPYSSPILLVSKPNGEKRLCIDYRKLNSITEKDRHPLPVIDDQIDQLRGYSYFNSLDLFSGYYQVEMDENSKSKTSFVTCDGQYEFNRMPFGLCNAPSVFQRIINRVLGPLRGTVALAYLDDILCPGKTFENALENLEKVFQTLQLNGLTLNPTKCHFMQEYINYLGYEISKQGVKPGSRKIKAIEEFPIPKNIHNIRQLLGLTGYFRRFVYNYARISKPLSKLLHKDQPWEWNSDQINSFNILKQKLIERPLLGIYNPSAETEIHTDACQSGIAGILLQKDKTEKYFKPVNYFSRQLNKAEQKWHSYELETLAVVETLKRYRVYLIGINFKVITDCNSIKAASEKKDVVPRIARWWLQL